MSKQSDVGGPAGGGLTSMQVEAALERAARSVYQEGEGLPIPKRALQEAIARTNEHIRTLLSTRQDVPTGDDRPVPRAEAAETGSMVPERVIVAPAHGTFRPVSPPMGAETLLDEEQVIGFVEGPSRLAPVRSPFRGVLMGLLSQPGERVREGQPVAWLRLGDLGGPTPTEPRPVQTEEQASRRGE